MLQRARKDNLRGLTLYSTLYLHMKDSLFCETALYVFMQIHSSFVVTDPKGTVLIECGKMIDKGGYRIKVSKT